MFAKAITQGQCAAAGDADFAYDASDARASHAGVRVGAGRGVEIAKRWQSPVWRQGQ